MTKRYFSEKPKLDLPDFLKNAKKDDLILLGLILFLIGDGCEDKELLFMLGFLFVTEKIPFLENED